METAQNPEKPQRQRYGGPLRVLLVIDPPALLLRMGEVLRSLPRAQLAGAFKAAEEATDWLVWDRKGWNLAYVDLSLPGSEDLIRRLLSAPRPGTVVGVSDHLWREVRERCAALGVYHIIEKGDAVAFRDDIERRTA